MDEAEVALAVRQGLGDHFRSVEVRPGLLDIARIPSRLARSDSSSPRSPASTRTIASFWKRGLASFVKTPKRRFNQERRTR
jgi:hypothetical protein